MNAEDETKLAGAESWAASAPAPSRKRLFRVALTIMERKVLLFAVDLLLINGALYLAVSRWTEFSIDVLDILAFGKWFITLSLLWSVISMAMNIYNPLISASTTWSVLYTGVTAFLVAVFYWLIPWLTPPPGRRLLVLGSIFVMCLLVPAWRAFYTRLFTQPGFSRRVLLVGEERLSRQIAGDLDAAAGVAEANPLRGTGYHIVGMSRQLLPPASGALDPALQLVRLIRQLDVQEVLVTDPATLTDVEKEALLDCREIGIHVRSLASTYERLTSRLPVEYAVHESNLIMDDDDNPVRHIYTVAKRGVDILLALLGVAVLVPVSLVVTLVNAFTSPGPLFYRQTRVGAGGRPFIMYKYRTMRPDAESPNGAVWSEKGDPRITSLGSWMRKLRVDELPQVINVLKGEMSVIGPRPERPQFVGEISRQLPIYRARNSVKPGITGWAQVYYRYGDSVEDARIKLEYDLYYIKHAGFWVDALILLRTLPTMLMLRGQ